MVAPDELANWLIASGHTGRLSSALRIASAGLPEESGDALRLALAKAEFWSFESYKRSRDTEVEEICFELWRAAITAFTHTKNNQQGD